jgi:MarR family transcriptional regulator, organic hydroperoxide resistance regulator
LRHTVIGKSKLPPTVSNPRLLHERSDQRFRQMMYDVTLIAEKVQRIRGHLASYLDMTPPQYNIMMAVSHLGAVDGVEVGVIARHLHVSPAFVTMEVKKLTRRKLVEKLPNPADQRSILVRLTAQAEQMVSGLTPLIQEVNDHFFGIMSKEEFQVLAQLGRRLAISAVESEQLTTELLENRIRRANRAKAAGSRQKD